MNYPTKEQILENKTKIKEWKNIRQITLDWKTIYYDKQWKKYHKHKKTYLIAVLICRILDEMKNKAVFNVNSHNYSYNIQTKTINLIMNKPSIISSLHELGHALFGKSELEACSFSVHLFKECFEEEYKKLIWHNHMLKLPMQKKSTAKE